MEHQNESGRSKLEVVETNSKEKKEKGKISHSASLRSEDLEVDISKNTSRQNSISSAVSGTTRPDQGRAEDFFDVRRIAIFDVLLIIFET